MNIVLRSKSRPGVTVQIVAAVAAVVLALTGCTSPATGLGQPTPGADGTFPAAEGTTQYPLTLKTAWGETVLQKRPERIVALGAIDIELVVALGIAPVAVSSIIERAYWVQQAMPGGMDKVKVYDFGDFGDSPNLEEIANSKPDLIVAGGDISKTFSQLSAIAPVVGSITASDGPGSGWRDPLQALAQALDLTAAGAKVVENYDATFAKIRTDNPEFKDRTITYAIQYNAKYGTTYSSSAGSPVEQFFLDLGFSANPKAKQFAENQVVSAENVDQLDADVLVVAATVDEAEAKRLLFDNRLFQSLPVVKNGRWAAFYTAQEGKGYSFEGIEKPGNINWAMAHGGGPIGKQWAAETLVPILRQAVEG